MLRRVILVLALLAAAPFATAQVEHQHGGGKGMDMVLHDGPDNGRAVVGAPTHFGFALLNNGTPVVHQNAQFVVTQANETVFSTEDTHEYDGLFSFDMVFERAGPYQVMAMADGFDMSVFKGEAVAPVNATAAKIVLTPTAAGPAMNAVNVVLDIQGPDGKTIPHTDAIVETRSAKTGLLFARTHLHIHTEPIQFTQALGLDMDYVMHVTAYQAYATGRHDDVVAAVADFPVSGGPLAVPVLPKDTTPPQQSDVLQQIGASAKGTGITLQATYDPEQQVGVGQVARIAGIATNSTTMMPQPHVDFAFELHGPRGIVFQSTTLHEYDGVFEYLFVPEAPGVYEGTMSAIQGDDNLTVPIKLQVVPPAVPLSRGVGMVSVDGIDKLVAGTPSNVTFSVMEPDGAVQHSEVDVTVFEKDHPALYQFKLHTHESGLTHATLDLPHGGDWMMTIDPLPTAPEPVVFAGPAGVGQQIAFDLKVAGGAVPDVIAKTSVDTPLKTVPGAGILLALAAVGTALLAAKDSRKKK